MTPSLVLARAYDPDPAFRADFPPIRTDPVSAYAYYYLLSSLADITAVDTEDALERLGGQLSDAEREQATRARGAPVRGGPAAIDLQLRSGIEPVIETRPPSPPCRAAHGLLHSAPLHWGVADRRETPRDARQHTWRPRHGARDGITVRRDLWFLRAVPGLGRRAGNHCVDRFPARRSLHANLSDFDDHRRARRDRRQDAAACR